MTRWFTSDTHFGHKNIIKYCARPFGGTREMDETMIRRWNEVVGTHDDVFHLGDVLMGDFDAGIACVSRLNGFIRLVPGNHDRIFSLEKESRRQRYRAQYERVFHEILPEQVHMTLRDGREVEVSHFPYQGDSHTDDRFELVRPEDKGLPIVHGHVHEKWKVNGRQVNVGVDVWDFYPVSEDDVIKVMT